MGGDGMAGLYVDTDKYAEGEGPAIIAAFHTSMKQLVRDRWKKSGLPWKDFVFGASYDLITKADFEALEAQVLASGHRFTGSAMISVRERPDAYKPMAGADGADGQFSFEHPEAKTEAVDATGKRLSGQGDNVLRTASNTIGHARYIRSMDQVLHYLSEGLPDDTIAIIDDSGGTLTAPILSQFKGVICAGGTVRSHLGILTREYGIPCVMNAKISGIHEGDRVEIETTAVAKTAEAYQKNIEMIARVWKFDAA